MFKKYLSYFIPINVVRKKSALSKTLEITWTNGQLVLDSENTNYSFGSLQRILRRGLRQIGFSTVKSMSEILVLGVAGGSVIRTINEEIGFKGKITGIDIDPDIIQIANEHFKLNVIPNLSIIVDDAFEFVLKTKLKYDLIIIDIFQDLVMPNFLFEVFFTNRLSEILNINGYLLFNTMTLNESHKVRNNQYIANFDSMKYSIEKISKIENHNELLLIKKLS